MGYAAPEYIQTGRLTAKSDIWSYGVVLYELITGRQPMDRNRPRKEQKLLEWVKPYTSDAKKFHLIVDPKIDDNYCLKQAMELSAVANKCLMRSPKLRPKMSDVLGMVQRIVCTENGTLRHPSSHFPEERSCREREGRGMDLKTRISDLKV